MSAANQRAEAVLVVDDRIVAVGSAAKIQSLMPDGTRVIDLQGKTLLPGFVDAHSHFPSSGLTTLGINLAPSPVGGTDTLSSLLTQVEQAVGEQADGSWIIGFNYDDSSLDIQRHPTRQEIDRIAPDNPVYLWHRSGHMGVANSRALEVLGISALTVSTPEGHVERDASGRLTGLLQEHAAPPLVDLLKFTPKTKWFNVLLSARDEYLAAGVTTIQNGYAGKGMIYLLRALQMLKILPQRIVVWPAHDKFENQKAMLEFFERDTLSDETEFRLGAIKLIVDGSPQGRTAWLREPYLTETNGVRDNGSAAMDIKFLQHLVRGYHRAGRQLALHGNGSAAIDAIITAVQLAQREFPDSDLRHILVHGQTVQPDQLLSLIHI